MILTRKVSKLRLLENVMTVVPGCFAFTCIVIDRFAGRILQRIVSLVQLLCPFQRDVFVYVTLIRMKKRDLRPVSLPYVVLGRRKARHAQQRVVIQHAAVFG